METLNSNLWLEDFQLIGPDLFFFKELMLGESRTKLSFFSTSCETGESSGTSLDFVDLEGFFFLPFFKNSELRRHCFFRRCPIVLRASSCANASALLFCSYQLCPAEGASPSLTLPRNVVWLVMLMSVSSYTMRIEILWPARRRLTPAV